jgi:cell division protein FtsZ
VMLPSLMNIDFADLRMIMGNAGTAMISIGEASGTDRVNSVIQSTLEHPLLDVDYAGSKGALILINGGPQMTLGEAVKIGEGITDAFDSKAYVKWGARISPDLGDKIIVTAVVTGVTSPNLMRHAEAKKAAVKETMGLENINFV